LAASAGSTALATTPRNSSNTESTVARVAGSPCRTRQPTATTTSSSTGLFLGMGRVKRDAQKKPSAFVGFGAAAAGASLIGRHVYRERRRLAVASTSASSRPEYPASRATVTQVAAA